MRTLLKIVLLAVFLYGAGFVVFAYSVVRPSPPPNHADAIVALTGGESRLHAAARLLDEGYGQRLLITGVDTSATKADIKRVAHGGKRFDCCTDLGFVAADTNGNAEEAAAWVRQHRYKSVIVVTADYHMPRTLAEFSAAMPRIALIPYAVRPTDIDLAHWWRGGAGLRLLNEEYVKFILSETFESVKWAHRAFDAGGTHKTAARAS